MKLIKKLNEQRISDARPDSKFKYLDIDSITGINDILEGDFDSDYTARKDMDKLVDQYKEKDFSDMEEQEVKDMIGDDLEMLEYDSAQIKKMIPYVLNKLKNTILGK